MFLFCDTSHNTMLFWIFKNCMQINSRTSPSGNSNSPLTRTKFSFPWSNFTEIYAENSNSPLTRTVFRVPSVFELPGATVSSGHLQPTVRSLKTRKWKKKKEESLAQLVTTLSLPVLSPFSHPFFQNKAIKSKTFLLKMSFSCTRI